jgi:hypothetical protein
VISEMGNVGEAGLGEIGLSLAFGVRAGAIVQVFWSLAR